MAEDTSEVTFVCPLCGKEKPAEKKIRQHIDAKEDHQHKRHSYNTDITIPMKHPNIIPENSSKSLHNKIKKAGEMINEGKIEDIDELNNIAIKRIEEEANTHRSHIMRVFEDEDVDYHWKGRKPSLYADQLTENQKDILKEYVRRDKPELTNGRDGEITTPQGRIAKAQDTTTSTVKDTIQNYGWILGYDADDIIQQEPKGEVVTEGVEEALKNDMEEESEQFHKESADDGETVELSIEPLHMIHLEKLADAEVDFDVQVVIQEKQFDAVKKLIKCGHEELAEEVNKGVYIQ